MKKTKLIQLLCISAAFSLVALAGCKVPANSDSAVTADPTVVASDTKTPAADTTNNTDTEKERESTTPTGGGGGGSGDSGGTGGTTVDVILPSDYVRGFDASYVDQFEIDNGKKYYDTDGSQPDFFEILKNHGINTVRLRIWVDPENAEENGIVSNDEHWVNSGMNTLERTIRLAKRVKAAGLKIMLDFHYSDYWTDPGKQIIPKAWQSIATADALATKLSDYTKEVLNAMKTAEVPPDYVQVGNEIDTGLFLHTSYNGSTGKTTDANSAVQGKSGSANFTKYLKAGCDAVRDACPSAKIILHVTNRKPTNILTTTVSSALDYDIVGLSYYSWESSHGTIKNLRDNVTAFKNTYNKAVMVVETSMYWKYGEYDANYRDLSFAAQHLVDPDTGKVYTDLTTKTVTYNGADTLIVEGTLANQVNTFRHIIEESAQCGATGICAWGGDMRGEWKYSFFEYEGKAMSSIDVFKVNLTAK